MQILLNIIISYLVGSISGSMVLGYLKGIDIRAMGSGNAGGTNAFRTVGAFFALGVIFIDILKGIFAVLFISKFNFIDIYENMYDKSNNNVKSNKKFIQNKWLYILFIVLLIILFIYYFKK